MHILHPISHHDVTKLTHTHTANTTGGADVDVAAALLANHDQQADVMIHERDDGSDFECVTV